MFQFLNKEYSWLFAGLLLLGGLFFLLLAWKKKVTRRIGDVKSVGWLTRNHSPRLFSVKFILISLAFTGGVLAVMNPGKPGESGPVNKKGIDIAIALDVSRSMLAADLAPNRLERAKQFIGKLMNEMPNDRIALVVFAGKAYVQMPLTTDHGAAALFVSAAGPDAVPQQGTVISDALQMSAKVFPATGNKYKTVILISDGEDHEEDAVTTARDLAEEGVMINTVGIGSPEGTTIPDPATGEARKDDAGNTVVSKLNEGILKEIAAKSNGIYTRLQGSDAAVAVLTGQLSQIDRKAIAGRSEINFQYLFTWFAAAMFLLLLTELFIPERKKMVLA